MLGVQLADVSTRCSSHPQGISLCLFVLRMTKMSASCTPSIKLSSKNLCYFYTAATENDVTSDNTILHMYYYHSVCLLL